MPPIVVRNSSNSPPATMDTPHREEQQAHRRRQLAGGLLLGNVLIVLLLLALGAALIRPGGEVPLLIGLAVLLIAVASRLYYAAWSREARDARSLLAQGLSYRTLLRTAGDAIHVLDRQGRITELSDSFAAMLGCTREDLIGRHASSWDAHYGTDQMHRWFVDSRPGHVRKFDTLYRRADGTLIDVEVNCSVVRIDGRDLIYCSARDMSDLLRVRRQLQAALHEQNLMLNNDLIGIVKTCGQAATWANPAMSSIFGYRPEEFLGQPLRMLYPDESAYRAFVDEAIPVLREGGRLRRQVLTLRKSGEPVWIDVYGVLLSPASQEALWLLADITPIQESLKRAEYIAFHDPLTGLANRLLLADRLKQAIALAERDRRQLSVCFLDLDGFKHVNDELGHAAGDELLKTVAQRLASGLRAGDTVARIGGDEFVLVLSPREDAAEISAMLERVRRELALPIELLDGSHAVTITASIGVTCYPKDGATPEALLHNADRAMYQAKRSGRNRVCFYDDSPAAGN